MKRITLQSADRRSGFTLVEMLVVITIIGILAALLIPAISGIVKKGKETAIAMEVDGLAQAIEQYNNTYHDYPPDFSDPNVVLRHFQRIRPQMVAEERNLLLSLMTDASGNTPSPYAINRAEAIVFALGGYSDDQKRPLTGPGGPFTIIDTTKPVLRGNVRYNPDRTNKLFDFELGRLRIDDDVEGPSQAADPLPTFAPSGLQQPYVYFDSRTYGYVTVNNVTDGNLFIGSGESGAIRAYKTSEQPRSPGGASYGSKLAALDGFRYQKPDTFQIISAGLDDIYGASALVSTANGDPVYYISENGAAVYPNDAATNPAELSYMGIKGFEEASASPQNVNGHLDNITNFFSGRLDDQLVEL